MKLSIRTIIIAIIVSFALFIFGHYIWGDLFIALLPVVGNVNYIDNSLTGQFIDTIWFSLTLALIPMATILVWRFAPVFKRARKFLTVFFIIITMTVSLLIRREMIRNEAKQLPPTAVLDYINPDKQQSTEIIRGIPVSTFHFERYALAGLITGSVIAFAVLRQKRR